MLCCYGVLRYPGSIVILTTKGTRPHKTPSYILTIPLYNRQPTLWLHDLCLEVAPDFIQDTPPIHSIVSYIWHSSSRHSFKLLLLWRSLARELNPSHYQRRAYALRVLPRTRVSLSINAAQHIGACTKFGPRRG